MEDGSTLLLPSAASGSLSLVAQLLGLGVKDVDRRALRTACKQGHLDIVKVGQSQTHTAHSYVEADSRPHQAVACRSYWTRAMLSRWKRRTRQPAEPDAGS